jgi:hypothetical protein
MSQPSLVHATLIASVMAVFVLTKVRFLWNQGTK